MLPKTIPKEELAAALRQMADLVEKDGSNGGAIQYEAGDVKDTFLVLASWMVGNLNGKGGLRMIIEDKTVRVEMEPEPENPELAGRLKLIRETPGLWIATMPCREGAEVPLCSIGGRIYSMLKDDELGPDGWDPAVVFHGPFRAVQPPPSA